MVYFLSYYHFYSKEARREHADPWSPSWSNRTPPYPARGWGNCSKEPHWEWLVPAWWQECGTSSTWSCQAHSKLSCFKAFLGNVMWEVALLLRAPVFKTSEWILIRNIRFNRGGKSWVQFGGSQIGEYLLI